jgi:GntR family transcriptional repressor for pyruvate dehydrogenase complex
VSFPRVANSQTLVQQIITQVRENLVTGQLLPGDRLPSEANLVEQFGVGRTSVREAMKVLAALGVIEIRRGEGTFVATGPSFEMLNPLEFALILDPGESSELLELRRIIDLGCSNLVARHATEEDLERLSSLAGEYRQLVESGADVPQIAAKDLEFHKAFLEATRNRSLIKVGRTVLALFTKSILKAVADRKVAEKGVEHHLEIVEAIRRHEVDRIADIVDRHLSIWYARVSA